MKGVIFDRDGVIIDSESINIISTVDAFQALGISIEENDKELIIGRHPDDFKDDFFRADLVLNSTKDLTISLINNFLTIR